MRCFKGGLLKPCPQPEEINECQLALCHHHSWSLGDEGWARGGRMGKPTGLDFRDSLGSGWDHQVPLGRSGSASSPGRGFCHVTMARSRQTAFHCGLAQPLPELPHRKALPPPEAWKLPPRTPSLESPSAARLVLGARHSALGGVLLSEGFVLS